MKSHFILLLLGLLFCNYSQPIFAQNINCESINWYKPRLAGLTDNTYRMLDDTLEIEIDYKCGQKTLKETDFTIYVNNVPLPTAKAGITKVLKQTFKARIELTPSTDKYVVEVGVGNMRSEKLYVVYDSKPNLYIFSVGVPFENLLFTEKDAKDVKEIFELQSGKFFENVYPKLLIGAEASESNILTELQELKDMSKEQNIRSWDFLVFFFSSHGTIDKDSTFYLKCYNFQQSSFDKTTISSKELADALNQLPCKKLVLIDACHSGSFQGKKGDSFQDQFPKEMKQLTRNMNATSIIAAANKNEEAIEDTLWQNGVFTEALLLALSGEADSSRNNAITFGELAHYLITSVPKMLEKLPSAGGKIENVGLDNDSHLRPRQTPTVTKNELPDDMPIFYVTENPAELLKQGEAALKIGNYKIALNAYFSAAVKEKKEALQVLKDWKPKEGKKLVKTFLSAWELNDKEAQYQIADAYYTGKELPQNYDKAVFWLQKSVAQNYAKAQNLLGVCYYYGNGIKKDNTESFNWCLKAAKQGFARGQRNIGLSYLWGEGVEKDYKSALPYLQKAANQNDSTALYYLGYMYELGKGVEKNNTKAAEYYQKSANLGYSDALEEIGRRYIYGEGVEQDYDKAIKCLNKAINKGNKTAKHILAECYNQYAASLLNKGNNNAKALDYAEKSIKLLEELSILKDISKPNKYFYFFCNSYNITMTLNIKLGNIKNAKQNFDSIQTLFLPIYKRWSWDWTLGHNISIAHNIFGVFLFSKGMYAEAFPLLQYASLRGIRESTECLVKINKERKNVDEAARLEAISKKQSMQKFTLPFYYEGSATKRDVFILDVSKEIADKEIAYKGIDGWRQLYKELLEETIEDEVGTSFDELQELAWKNDVSYPDLCLYALQAAEKDINERESFEKNKQKAENGDKDAQFKVAEFYRQGLLNDTLALFWYKKAAVQKHAKAQYYVGEYYALGKAIKTDFDLSFYWYKKAAEQNDTLAQYYVGFDYEKGRGVEKNIEQAIFWYKKAAENNHIKAQYNLAMLYLSIKNTKEYIKWLTKAADQKDADAQYELGIVYMNGEYTQKDEAKAVALYTLSAEQDNKRAQSNLGYMYMNGLGTKKNDEQAVYWFKKSAEQGWALGQSNLGYMYMYGLGTKQNDEQAVYWFKKSAAQGQSLGQANLGVMYLYGRGGLKQSDNEAFYWFEKAASQGEPSGLNGLGIMYFNGKAVKKDEKEAIRLFCLAAKQGNASAIDNLKQVGATCN